MDWLTHCKRSAWLMELQATHSCPMAEAAGEKRAEKKNKK